MKKLLLISYFLLIAAAVFAAYPFVYIEAGKILITNGRIQFAGALAELMYFVTPPTPVGGSTITTRIANISVDLTMDNLKSYEWDWSGTNVFLYDTNLIVMYNFNKVSALGETTNVVKDLSKYGNHATVKNGAVWSSNGVYGGQYALDVARTQYVEAATSGSLSNLSHYTLAVWGRFTSALGNKVLATKRGTGSSTPFHWYVEGADYYTMRLGTSLYKTDTKPVTNTLFHLAVTYDKSRLVTYLNGESNKSWAVTTTLPTTLFPLQIGYRQNNPGECFPGTIDEFRLYSRALTRQEVRQLYRSNLSKYAANKWSMVSTQTGLGNGTYSFEASAISTDDETETTGSRAVTVNAP